MAAMIRPQILLVAALGLALPAAAQEPPPAPDPAEADDADEGDEADDADDAADDADGADADDADGEPPPRARHLEKLRGTLVHFDFARAPLEDITTALQRASGVPVRIGRRARAALERRRFRMRYTADRRGHLVLEDLAKAAALDFEVTDDGAVLDLPIEIRRLRRRLGIEGEEVRLEPEDVAELLDTKRISLLSREKPLRAVLAFLHDETGVSIVRIGDDPEEEPVLTLRITDEPFAKVLDRVLHPVGFDWMLQGRVVVVGTTETIAAQRALPPPDAEGDDGDAGD